MLAVDRTQTFIKGKAITATEELLLWWNRLFLSCRDEIFCPPPVRPPGSSARSLGVLLLCKSTFPVLQLVKHRAATSLPELAAGSTGSRQRRRHLGAVPLEASSTLENCLGSGGEKRLESVFQDPALIPTWYRDSKLSLPMISVLRWEMHFSYCSERDVNNWTKASKLQKARYTLPWISATVLCLLTNKSQVGFATYTSLFNKIMWCVFQMGQ